MEIMPKSSVNMQSIEMKRDHNNVKSELCAIETEKIVEASHENDDFHLTS